MQDFETSQDSAQSFDDENSQDRLGAFLKSLIKRFVVFACFGPGVVGILWIIGRLFKR